MNPNRNKITLSAIVLALFTVLPMWKALGQVNQRLLYIQFKEALPGPPALDDNGIAYFGMPAMDSLNSLFKCMKAEKCYKRTNARTSPAMRKTYILHFMDDLDIDSASAAYLRTGLLENVRRSERIGVKGGGASIFSPNDARYSQQWALNNDSLSLKAIFPSANVRLGADMKMGKAWDCEQGDSTIIAAILDSGCRTGHPDLASRIWANRAETPGDNIDNDGNGYVDDIQGWDFRHQDNSVEDIDPNGHGTGITAIIGAEGDNGIGTSGVDLNCRLMVLKFVDTLQSSVDAASVAEAIRYAVDNGAHVINFSYTFTVANQLIEDAILYAHQNEVAFVSITGNDNLFAPTLFPAAFPDSLGIVVVGATDPDDRRSNAFIVGGGSNWSDRIDVSAPGNYIIVPDNFTDTEYFWVAGTSAAAAHFTGLFSLARHGFPNLSKDSIIALILRNADDLVGNPSEDTPGFDNFHGFGRLNAEKVLCLANGSTQSAGEGMEMSIFPNPSADFFNISLARQPRKGTETLLFNSQGLLVSRRQHPPSRLIQMEAPCPAGYYFLQLIVDGEKLFGRNLLISGR
jgi:subtilisin family serine protease